MLVGKKKIHQAEVFPYVHTSNAVAHLHTSSRLYLNFFLCSCLFDLHSMHSFSILSRCQTQGEREQLEMAKHKFLLEDVEKRLLGRKYPHARYLHVHAFVLYRHSPFTQPISSHFLCCPALVPFIS